MLMFYTQIINENEHRIKFEKLYTLYKNKMWYTANTVLKDEQLAEDAVHNAFIGIAKNIRKIDDVQSSKTFYYVITAAKNAALDILRKNKSAFEADIDSLYFVSDNESSTFSSIIETEDLIVKTIASMPLVYRDVLYLLIVEQMTEKEIAVLLGRKPGTVHQQVRRGRAIIREELKKGESLYGNK